MGVPGIDGCCKRFMASCASLSRHQGIPQPRNALRDLPGMVGRFGVVPEVPDMSSVCYALEKHRQGTQLEPKGWGGVMCLEWDFFLSEPLFYQIRYTFILYLALYSFICVTRFDGQSYFERRLFRWFLLLSNRINTYDFISRKTESNFISIFFCLQW